MSALRPWSDFNALIEGIGAIDSAAAVSAGRQLQQILSLRNWLIGVRIVAYEQDGADRAAYGTGLLNRISAELTQSGRRGFSARNLRNYRQVALAYPTLDPRALAGSALAEPGRFEIWQAPAKSPPTSESAAEAGAAEE